MTAVRAAGFTSNPKATGAARSSRTAGASGAAAAEARGQLARGQVPRDGERSAGLIEESGPLAQQAVLAALDRAKEAGKLERQLRVKREENGLADQINIDYVLGLLQPGEPAPLLRDVHRGAERLLAHRQEQVRTVRPPARQHGKRPGRRSTRPRSDVSWPSIRSPTRGADRYKIMRNIGNSFVRLGQFQDAISSFEQIMDGSPDLLTASTSCCATRGREGAHEEGIPAAAGARAGYGG